MLFTPSGKKSHIFARVGLTLALVANLTLPAFASDLSTGSAFGVDERLLSVPRLAASSSPVGSSTNPYYVRPYTNGSATVYRYSWSTSNPNGSSSGTNQSFTNFADIVTHITGSIANSFLALGQRLHFDNDAIYGRLYDILSAINSHAPLDSVKINSNSSSNFSYSYLWAKSLDSDDLEVSTYSSDGVKGSNKWKFHYYSLLGAIEYLTYHFGNDMVNGFSLISRFVVNNSSSDNDFLTLSDLSTSPLDSSSSASIWSNMRDYFTNVSDHLAHLRYVLANDEDIALRQTQHDNLATVTSDFTSGDVSVTPAKLGGLKSVGSALSDGLSSSASVSDGLSVLGSGSDAWKWFSDENAQAFDSASSSRNNLRFLKSGSGYLEQYYKDVSPYVD